jgi:exopolysaccharide biosynthesis protein
MYGPFEKIRFLWINTAMYSSHFKFLATCLFSKEYIAEVLSKSVGPIGENTDTKKIKITSNKGIICIPVMSDYYRGFIIKINNPRRITLVGSNNQAGEILESFVNRFGAVGGINASGYRDDKKRGVPWGYTVIDEVTVSDLSMSEKHSICGFTKDYVLSVGSYTDEEIKELDFLWAVEFGPILLSNGKKTVISEYAGGYAPRTAIGQTANGTVLFVVIDGRQTTSLGATFKDVQDIFEKNGAVNACCLDGGSSSTIMYDRMILNTPSEGVQERLLPNAILVKSYESIQN